MVKKAQQRLTDINTPHPHDVLSGRGNFVNSHAGNVNFRYLVKMHQEDYVFCPKDQKVEYAHMIVDAIRNVDPPGRFLKQDPNTSLWQDISDKKALNKTRQALREGAPEMAKKKLPENCTLSRQYSGAKEAQNLKDNEQGKQTSPIPLQTLSEDYSSTSKDVEYLIPEEDERSRSISIHLENLDDDDINNNGEETNRWKMKDDFPSNPYSYLSSGNMSISFGEMHYENSLSSMIQSISFTGCDKKLGQMKQNMSDSDSWGNLSQVGSSRRHSA